MANIELCARAEFMKDLIRLSQSLLADCRTADCISDMRITREPRMDAEIRLVFSTPNTKPGVDIMRRAVETFVQIIENQEDAHVVAESLHFASEYDGERMDSSMQDRIVAHLKHKITVS